MVVLYVAAPPARAQDVVTIDEVEKIRQPFMTALSPHGTWLSYVIGDTLWIVRADGSARQQAVSSGMSNQVNYDRPFHAWSPDGKRLLYRTGTSGVRGIGTPMVYDIVADRSRPLLEPGELARLQTFLHWAADGPAWSPDGSSVAFLAADTGLSPRHLNLYLVNTKTREARLIVSDTTGPVGGVAGVAWSPDGRWLAFGAGAFSGKGGRLILRPAGGVGEIVISTGAPMYRSLSWSPDSHLLSALSHNGTRMLFEVSESGETRVVSDSVPFAVADIGWTVDGRVIGRRDYGMSAGLTAWSPADRTSLTVARGDTLFRLVGASASASGQSTLVAYSKESGSVPLDVWVGELPRGAAQFEEVRQLTRANEWLNGRSLARARIEQWTSSAGDSLDALLFLPPPEVASPPYPLVVRPYGGYTNEFPKSEYFMDAGTQLLAARGWAVVLPNTRGMAGRPLTGRYGEVQLEDTRALVDRLAAQGLVDPKRVAVFGHSHGGAMAYYFLTHDDDLCAVVAVNGWSDWSEIANRLQSSAEELPATLARSSPILNASAASAPLLAVSGAADTQVPPENAKRMVEALSQLGRQADWLHFVDEGHLLTKPSNRRRFWTAVLAFVDTNCRSRR